MAAFQIRKIHSIVVIIIVLIAILWLFQDNIAKVSVFQKHTQQFDTIKEEMKNVAYLEKIDNFLIKEFSKEQLLLHTIEADTYYSYKNSGLCIRGCGICHGKWLDLLHLFIKSLNGCNDSIELLGKYYDVIVALPVYDEIFSLEKKIISRALIYKKKYAPIPKKDKNPITSVIVVTKTLDAIAGSILNFFRETGTKIPNSPATIIFNIIEIDIIKESVKSPNHN